MPLAITIDGRPSTEADATVSVLDRGFLFGDSVFEVVRTYGGVPFAGREHLERLARSCEGLGIVVPVSLDALEREIADTIARSGEPECYVRIVITRGRGPLNIDPAPAKHPLRVVIAAPLSPWPEGLHTRGVEVATVRVERATDHTRAAGAKVSAYVANMLALSTARERGAYEAMMVGAGGEISEGTTSNVFVVTAGEVRTPPLSMGILGGITRRYVLRAADDLGVPWRETVLFPRDLERADEAFLTSSLREVVPIVGVDGVRIGEGRPGPITARLLERYRELVRAHCDG
ncbi:aminotransferase class IV [Sandaracinus amylolyticus]|uniref:branched-chain-amino-acid transaminase n=1 Tax=Sandaracinus amylolyticus TaxID=927083 RepID=A0A0F6W488_9BACT|nr:aminotransferase class IV [Sandaracinus amylolyticus]AKF06890.1 D-alanine aminotransferase [Sandaracinus amylolyticus]